MLISEEPVESVVPSMLRFMFGKTGRMSRYSITMSSRLSLGSG